MSNAFIPDQFDQMSRKELLEFARTAHEENVRLSRRCTELELLIKDCDEYLDINRCSNIGYLSVLHKCMKQLRKEQEK